MSHSLGPVDGDGFKKWCHIVKPDGFTGQFRQPPNIYIIYNIYAYLFFHLLCLRLHLDVHTRFSERLAPGKPSVARLKPILMSSSAQLTCFSRFSRFTTVFSSLEADMTPRVLGQERSSANASRTTLTPRHGESWLFGHDVRVM